LPAVAQTPQEITQPIQCSQPDPAQPGFSCPDNWGLDRIDRTYPDNSYRYRWTGKGVHVYTLDSGIHEQPFATDPTDPGNREEFDDRTAGCTSGCASRIGTGFSKDQNHGTDDCLSNSHGTRIAAVIGGNRYGVAKGVTLHPVNYSYGCNVWTIQGFVDSLLFIRNHITTARNADPEYLAVVNISTNIPKLWGENSTAFCTDEDGSYVLCTSLIDQIVREIITVKEVPVVVSAGNYDSAANASDFAPSDVPEAFVIGGVDRMNARWRMKGTEPDYQALCNPGPPAPARPECGSVFGSDIDLWAPAELIRAPYNAGHNEFGPIDATVAQSRGVLSGTSFSAPHVTGAIALYMEKFKAKNLRRPTVAEVWSFLHDNALQGALTDIGSSPNLLLNVTFGPRPANDSFNTPHDALLQVLYSSLLANDQGEGLSVVLDGFSDPPHGTIEVCCNPSGFKYTPDPGYAGPDSFTYTVEDTDGLRSTATVNVNVAAGPLAAPDSFTTPGGTVLGVPYASLLANDQGQGLSVALDGFSDPPHGTVSVCCNPAGFRYTPDTCFVGTDTFIYTVTDSYGQHATAQVTMTVTNRPPVAVNDSAVTDRDTAVTIAVLANDSDPDCQTLSVVSVGGGAVINPNGTITYTPPAGFVGTASVQYTASDGHGGLASATVTVTVRPPERPPVANADAFSVVHNRPLDFTCAQLLANDSDPDGDPLSVTAVGQPTSGTISCTSCSCRFTPVTGFVGSVTFQYTISDGRGLTATATDTINVTNQQPVAVNDTAATPQNFPVTIYVLANDSDPDGDPLSVQSVTQPANGSAANGPGGASVVYTPGTQGTATFTYTVTDGKGGTATASVTVTVLPPNTPPDARGDQLAMPRGFTTTIGHGTLLANDFDADGNTLTIQSFNTTGLVGTLSCPTGGTSCTYTPPGAAYSGVTSYTYTVSDGHGSTDTATVKLKVGLTQSVPVAVDDLLTTTRNTARAFTIFDVLANDSDADGDVLTPQIGAGPRDYGTMSCTSPNYNCTYTPNAGFIGIDRFAYSVTDGADGSATAFIKMAVLPPAAPVLDAREDQTATNQNTQTYLSYNFLLGNDYSPNGYALTVTAMDTTGLNGALTCDTFGCVYQPSSYFAGTTKLRYTVSDGHGGTDTAVVKIKVGVANAVPVAANDALTTPKNTPLRFSIFDLMKNDYDPDNDPLNVIIYPYPAHGTVSCSTPTYWCTYTPNANVTGTDSFTYVLSDGITYAATATVNVTVTP
jgi:hypothetical protein